VTIWTENGGGQLEVNRRKDLLVALLVPSAYSSRRMALLERLGDSGIMAISRFKLVLSNVLRGYLQDEKVQSRFQRNFDC
jgi:hypothetical protein